MARADRGRNDRYERRSRIQLVPRTAVLRNRRDRLDDDHYRCPVAGNGSLDATASRTPDRRALGRAGPGGRMTAAALSTRRRGSWHTRLPHVPGVTTFGPFLVVIAAWQVVTMLGVFPSRSG